MSGLISPHKRFYFLLFLFALLFWLVTVQVKNGRFPVLERPVLAVSGFFERIIAWPYNTAASLTRNYVLLVDLQRENRRLGEEIDRLRLESSAADELLLENDRLREALAFKKRNPPASIMVQLIGRDLSPASSTITVNKGSHDGLDRDMPVVAPDGVVGKIQAVTADTAKIILLTDPGSTIAVRVQRNREEGLLEGKLVNCFLKYVSFYTDIQEGDVLITSGLDGIYPPGLPVAMVVKVVKNEANAFQTVVAKPVVQLSRLEEVLVLKK